jgi:hypothetical protein
MNRSQMLFQIILAVEGRMALVAREGTQSNMDKIVMAFQS